MAARLLEQWPDPPRRVRPTDLLEIYGPALVFALVALPIVAALFVTYRVRGFVPATAVAAGVTFVFVAVVMALALARVRAALHGGLVEVGEVVSAGSYGGTVRVDATGGHAVGSYRGQSFRVGDRVKVLVNPQNGAVLLTLSKIG